MAVPIGIMFEEEFVIALATSQCLINGNVPEDKNAPLAEVLNGKTSEKEIARLDENIMQLTTASNLMLEKVLNLAAEKIINVAKKVLCVTDLVSKSDIDIDGTETKLKNCQTGVDEKIQMLEDTQQQLKWKVDQRCIKGKSQDVNEKKVILLPPAPTTVQLRKLPLKMKPNILSNAVFM